MAQTFDHGLAAKIPGQSLTMAPGSMPMERPPQLTDPKDAAEYFWNKLHTPKQIIKLTVLLRKGVPAEYIARTILFTAIVHGIIHINTALTVGRVLVKQIVAIGHLKGVKNMKIGNTDMDLLNFVNSNKDYMYDSPPPKDAAEENQSVIKKGLLSNG